MVFGRDHTVRHVVCTLLGPEQAGIMELQGLRMKTQRTSMGSCTDRAVRLRALDIRGGNLGEVASRLSPASKLLSQNAELLCQDSPADGDIFVHPW